MADPRPLARRPPRGSQLSELQTQLDAYDLVFNHQRPHQALDGRTPAQRFTEAEKATASSTPLTTPLQIPTPLEAEQEYYRQNNPQRQPSSGEPDLH